MKLALLLSLLMLGIASSSFADEGNQALPSADGAVSFVIGPPCDGAFDPHLKKWIRLDDAKVVKAIVKRISKESAKPTESACFARPRQFVALDSNGKVIQGWILDLSSTGGRMVLNRGALKLSGRSCRVDYHAQDPFLEAGIALPELNHLRSRVLRNEGKAGDEDGAVQPATTVESKSDGKEKPKPEPEGRPR